MTTMVALIPSAIRTARTHDDAAKALFTELKSFRQFNGATQLGFFVSDAQTIPTFTNEFWTAKQRAASRLHEISYRACFKPQLPRFFIERLTKPGDAVLDPFMGRGTTLLESALLRRIPFGCDANPLCRKLIAPRLNPPDVAAVSERLEKIDFATEDDLREDLLVFYHRETLQQLSSLRAYLLNREKRKALDSVDAWIQMVAVNRLTGHSRGFFSVYTLPPNQAVSVKSQQRINQRLGQKPGFRSVPELILAKTKSLLGNLTETDCAAIRSAAVHAKIIVATSENLPEISNASIDLVVTSPPFLKVVDYATDNWLRCWFLGMNAEAEPFQTYRKLDDWKKSLAAVLEEMFRVVCPGGWVAIEVGEVHRGKIQLESAVVPAGASAGFEPKLVLINSQKFTKTANCWGVRNNDLGTNTNRVVLFQKL